MNKGEMNLPGVTFTGDIHIAGDMFNIHDNQNVTIQMNTPQAEKQVTDAGNEASAVVPESLQTEDAKALMAKAVAAGWLDESWQPLGSLTEAAMLAATLAERLQLTAKWKVFGQLWKRNSESLRTKYNEALEQRKSLELQDKLKKSLK